LGVPLQKGSSAAPAASTQAIQTTEEVMMEGTPLFNAAARAISAWRTCPSLQGDPIPFAALTHYMDRLNREVVRVMERQLCEFSRAGDPANPASYCTEPLRWTHVESDGSTRVYCNTHVRLADAQ
jgi:hypothetical protein